MNDEEHSEVLDLFTQQPFFQHILKQETERKRENAKLDATLDELAGCLQNIALSLQSGPWKPAKVMKLVELLCDALRCADLRDGATVWQSMLLCMLTVIKGNCTKMSPASRAGVLQHLKRFGTETDITRRDDADSDTDTMWPISLRKVILSRSHTRPGIDDGGVLGWIDNAQQEPWREKWPVHVLMHDAVALGCAHVCTHDGVFVLISFPRSQIWDAGSFVY
jgi:hypothetical protein